LDLLAVDQRGGVTVAPLHPIKDAANWWLWLWGAVAVGLIVAVFVGVPFFWWAVAVFAGFGTMESIGVIKKDPRYPPLTDVIRAKIPIWASLPVMAALLAGAAAKWFGFGPLRAFEAAVLFGFAVWLIVHFESAYQ
jgi:hypothetical protein